MLAFVVAAGAIAADAVPLRRIPLACSVATLVLGLLLLAGRGDTQIPVAAAIVALQVVALGSSRRHARRSPRMGG